jgi:outer membrane lipoprotein-sorting protein
MVKFNDNVPTANLPQKHQELQGQSPLPKQIEPPPLIKEINQRTAKIKSFSCEDVEIKVWQNGHRFKLSGRMYYEKPKNFRFEINSILGKELDLGSNEEAFWYWSRRDPNPGLHWAKHNDYAKTRLKTPFNPFFMRASLGLETLDVSDAKLVENESAMMLVYQRTNGTGQTVLYSVFINKVKKQIDGFVITDLNGKTLAACEIQEWSGDLPTKVLYTWQEEERVMLIRFNRHQLNPVISPTIWQMPNYTPKINMGEQ